MDNDTTINPEQTVATLVLDHSECAPVFQRYRIDFCCRGELSIKAACSERGVDTDAVVEDLSRAIAERTGSIEPNPRTLSTADLLEHIVSKHHKYLRKTLPFVQALAAKVNRVHGNRNPRLLELDSTVRQLAEALIPHLDMEENALFPALVGNHTDNAFAATELASMHQEHMAVGKLLERMRGASEDFSIPEWACNSYRTLFTELEQLERDTLRHVHLENHVLMPRFASS